MNKKVKIYIEYMLNLSVFVRVLCIHKINVAAWICIFWCNCNIFQNCQIKFEFKSHNFFFKYSWTKYTFLF